GASLWRARGVGSAYAAVTCLYLAGLALTFGIARRRPVADPAEGPGAAGRPLVRSSGWRDLKEGVAYVVRTPALVAMMWLAFLVHLTPHPPPPSPPPHPARTHYHGDARRPR